MTVTKLSVEKLRPSEISALERFRISRRWSYRQLAAEISAACSVRMPEPTLTRALTVDGARLRATTVYPIRSYLEALRRSKQLRAAS